MLGFPRPQPRGFWGLLLTKELLQPGQAESVPTPSAEQLLLAQLVRLLLGRPPLSAATVGVRRVARWLGPTVAALT